jgi:hypothetical protein
LATHVDGAGKFYFHDAPWVFCPKTTSTTRGSNASSTLVWHIEVSPMSCVETHALLKASTTRPDFSVKLSMPRGRSTLEDASSVGAWGYAHYDRFYYSGNASLEGLEAAVCNLREASRSPASEPVSRIKVSQAAAELLTKFSRWREADELMRDAVDLLPALVSRALSTSDQQHALREKLRILFRRLL